MLNENILNYINKFQPSYWHDLVRVAKQLQVNLAIDNSGGDSDGANFAVMVVTPDTDPKVAFNGPELEFDIEEIEDDPSRLRYFLKSNNVVAVWSTSHAEAYSPRDYCEIIDGYVIH